MNKLAFFLLLILIFSQSSKAQNWKAFGGELDIQFTYKKLDSMQIKVSPQPRKVSDDWSQNHLVFKFNPLQHIEVQAPYGSIEAITKGSLKAHTDFSLEYDNTRIDILELNFIPFEKKNDYDVVTFKILDQTGQNLFTTDNIHIKYDKDKGLLEMDNMDLIVSSALSKRLMHKGLDGQVIAQLNLFTHLKIPTGFEFNAKGGNCLTNPNWRDGDEVIDVSLVSMPSIDWRGTLVNSNEIIVVPSAELLNTGTADVPWYVKFTGSFPPYNNDQHPYLVWNAYREVDHRFEQIGTSGIKHAFFSTNIRCACPGGNVLGVGCGDVYSATNNDQSDALGPRDEVEVFTGLWEGCGSFFDPDCTGSLRNISSEFGENRLKLLIDKLVPNMIMSSWYIVREDANIFNSMGYKRFSPTLTNGSWLMNPSTEFANGPAIYDYVPPNSIEDMQASQTISTNKGHITVAVKVIDLGNRNFRYNYAIDNHDYDPKLDKIVFNLGSFASISEYVFVDIDSDATNDWIPNHTNNLLNIENLSSNSIAWGSLYSFSITINSPPVTGIINLESVNDSNRIISFDLIVPQANDLIFDNGFE